MEQLLKAGLKGAVAVLAILGAMPALAQTHATLGTSAQIDDNVFNLPGGVDVANGRSDRIYSVLGSFDVARHPGDIAVDIAGNAAYNWFEKHSAYNNFNYTLQGDVQRAADNRLGFEVSGLSRHQLTSFADFNSTLRNTQQFDDVSTRVRLPITSEAVLVGVSGFRAATNSAEVFHGNDFHRYGGGVGIGWDTALGNTIEATVDYYVTNGLGPRAVIVGGTTLNQPTDVADLSGELLLRYAITPLTSLKADVSYVHRSDHTALHHNQNGVFGDLTLDYHPHPGLAVTATGGRRQQTLDYEFVDSVHDSYVQVTARARVFDRLQLNGNTQIEWRDYLLNSQLVSTVPSHHETLYQFGFGAEYPIFDRFWIGIQFTRISRAATSALERYHGDIVQISLTRNFGAASSSPDIGN